MKKNPVFNMTYFRSITTKVNVVHNLIAKQLLSSFFFYIIQNEYNANLLHIPVHVMLNVYCLIIQMKMYNYCFR